MKQSLSISALSFLSTSQALRSNYKTFDVVSTTFDELNSLEKLPEAVYETGIFSVSNVPQLAELKQKLYSLQAECSKDSRFQFTFPDGTARSTLAAKTTDGLMSEIEGFEQEQSSLTPACESFVSGHQEFRAAIAEVVSKFVNLLSEGENSEELMYDTEEQKFISSWNEVLSTGTQLEHFHTYRAPKSRSLSEFTMDLHKDDGLFIALTPAMLIKENGLVSPEKSGFFVELDGEVNQVNFGDSEVFFMIGDGVEKWMNHKLSKPLRAVPHALFVPEEGERAWYGRMVLPKSSVLLPGMGATYGQHRSLQQEASAAVNKEMNMAESLDVCGNGYKMDSRLLQDCTGENEIWCWMTCHDLTQECLDVEGEPVCAEADGTIADCDESDGINHKTNCGIRCLEHDDEHNATDVPSNIGDCEVMIETFIEEVTGEDYFTGDHEDDHDDEHGDEHDHEDEEEHDHEEGEGHDHRMLLSRLLQDDHDHEDEDEHDHDHDDLPSFLYHGCNSTHFSIEVDGEVSLYEIDWEVSVEDNCYYAYCQEDDEEHDHDEEGHEHDHRMLLKRALQDEHDHEDDHDHEHYFDSGSLITVHGEGACDEIVKGEDFHHTCDVDEFFQSLVDDDTDDDGIIFIAIAAVAVFVVAFAVVYFVTPDTKKDEVVQAKIEAKKDEEEQEVKASI